MAELRDILVYLHPEAAESPLIKSAASFAASKGVTLRGLFVLDIPEIPNYVKAELPQEVLENQKKIYLRRAEAAKAALDTACSEAGVTYDWCCIEGDVADTVIRYGRYVDVVLLEGTAEGIVSPAARIADRVILECGRPVLVMPVGPAPDQVGSRIALAWNAGKESVRALHDALPLLRGADWVKVVSVNAEVGDRAHGEVPGIDVGKHLARHGITAEAHSIGADSGREGATLLSWAQDEQSDLLVMGAYGHARWQELVLGGVTNYMLSHAASLPLLMSH